MIKKTCWLISRLFQNFFLQVIKRIEILKYIKTHDVRKLQLGSGPIVLDSWLNTDLYGRFTPKGIVLPLNLTKRFPFKSNTFDYIFSEHVIEHLTYEKGCHMLNESFRILKPGGRIRIATPDIKFFIDLYSKNKTSSQKKYIIWSVDNCLPHIKIYKDVFVINNSFRAWGHKFIYDFPTLKYALKKIGFINIKKCEIGKSSSTNFQNIESHGKFVCEFFNKLETFIIEATKPYSI